MSRLVCGIVARLLLYTRDRHDLTEKKSFLPPKVQLREFQFPTWAGQSSMTSIRAGTLSWRKSYGDVQRTPLTTLQRLVGRITFALPNQAPYFESNADRLNKLRTLAQIN
jgi:hypothetical protein